MKDLDDRDPPTGLDPHEIREEALELLSMITAEFRSDPHSVQCFDLRLVRRATLVSIEYERRKSEILDFML